MTIGRTISGQILGGLCSLGTTCACTEFAPRDDILVEREALQQQGTEQAPEQGSEETTEDRGDWECLGEPPFVGREANTATGPHTLRITVSAIDGPSLAGAVVRACAALDVDCATPAGEGVTDAAGQTNLPLLDLFNGALEVEAEGFVSTRIRLPGPVMTNGPFGVELIPVVAMEGLTESANAIVVPNTGIVSAVAYDCSFKPAAAIVFKNNVGGLPFYWRRGIPTLLPEDTDLFGGGGFLNVPAGMVEIRAERQGNGGGIASAIAVVREGWVNGVSLAPPAAQTHASVEFF